MKQLKDIFKYDENKEVYGLTNELVVQYINNYYLQNDENVIILTTTLYEANKIYNSLKTYCAECLLFPMDDFLTSVAIAKSPDFKIKRLEVQEKLALENNQKHIIVTSLMGYLKFLPNIKNEININITKNDKTITRKTILTKLEQFGYKKESIVTSTGEYAVRGFIIDIFPVNSEYPVRIEFFGDEIDEIKEFDEETQLSINKIQSFELKAYGEFEDDNPNSLLDYLKNKKTSTFLIDEKQILVSYANLLNTIEDYKQSQKINKSHKFMYDYNELHPDKTFKIDTINRLKNKNSYFYDSKELLNFNSNFNSLKKYCLKEVEKNTIIFILENERQVNKIHTLLEDAILTDKNNIYENRINIIYGKLNKGFIIDECIYISPYDIEERKNNEVKYKNSIKIGKKINNYNDINVGDYIVHESHGIGIYNGLKTLKTNGYEKDYIELIYDDNDKIFVPIENIQRLYKYTGKEGITPKLDKLNSSTWNRKKLATRKKIQDISKELLELYSSRTKIKTLPYKDFDEEISFALSFPFTLTKDQEKTINEINEDLKKTSPMDRLLCGDVGYGKTEVAFRAMFKAVLNDHQVAYLCPTTILAKQQYNSAVSRFEKFGINVKLLTRHTTIKEFNDIVKELENGTLDIIIGTHKLLNKSIKYKKLGLLVIDEEQRFGVTHKEKIKELKTDINVLTLSATPIPRTLKMALSGLRSLSVLDTPPVNRYPIQTYVIEENELLIKEAIYKELSRGGQVYILINSIENMPAFINKIQNLVKEARITSANGKMEANKINRIMEDFIDGKYDILICTTIIETGIDISNVNTIIIIDSDKFGLSQLYQIRGRVGRSDKIAYAYLMYNPAKILTETAVKRLNSIKEFTELGSGYKIAMRDLSIRGAGDLLGKEQAGFVDAVGLDLYTHMVNEEIQRLEGKQIDEENKLNTTIFNISTHIDNNYAEDENIRIEIHKLINSINNQSDLIKVQKELTDRFGKYDEKIDIYMLEKCTERIVKDLKITVEQNAQMVKLTLDVDTSNKIDGEKLFMDIYSINPNFSLSYKNRRIIISLKTIKLERNYIYYIFNLLNSINDQINQV